MNSRTAVRPAGQKINYRRIYTLLACCIACTVIFASAALKLSDHFSPQSLELNAIGGFGGFSLPITLYEDEVMEPGREGITKQPLYVIEEKKESTEQSSGRYPIIESDLSLGALPGQILVRDSDSGMSVDTELLLSSAYPKALSQGGISHISTKQQPLVLIVHTHATEAFTEEGVDTYTAQTTFRSSDKSKNMVAVGRVMAQVLNERGIPTLHCEILHDEGDYNGAYDNSLATVKKYLEQYPSIKYVFDLHRDAIIRENGEAVKPVCNIDQKKTAQVMILVGTNAGGADHSMWMENNMNLAVKLQYELTEEYTGIARPINLRKLSFHQQYAPGSLLFEIGSCANTLEEAKNAAKYLGNAIADVINNS
ncbi:MAG: stage II sporulation protein P [Clostridia bacterium]|nr:stage II sporulation protein P [Clostridia bacterium]